MRTQYIGMSFVCMATLAVGCKPASAESSERSDSSSTSVAKSDEALVALTGSGSSFVKPMLDKWTSEYKSVDPGTKLNYQATGSGQGIRNISDGTVDFAASDAPMSDDAVAKAGGGIVQIPIVIGAVVVIYNVKGAPDRLRLTPELLSSIYLGEVKTWDDARIVAENPGAKLPKTALSVVRRADGSGTTAIFTDYLSKVSPTWKSQVGSGTSVKWPIGTGGNQNAGVTALVKQTDGAIGYVELAYAKQNKLSVADLKNRAGTYVSPTLASITASAAGSSATGDLRRSLTDPESSSDAYPISGFVYLLMRDTKDGAKGRAMGRFFRWALTDGQAHCAGLDYAKLPPELSTRGLTLLGTVKAAGASILPTP